MNLYLITHEKGFHVIPINLSRLIRFAANRWPLLITFHHRHVSVLGYHLSNIRMDYHVVDPRTHTHTQTYLRAS